MRWFSLLLYIHSDRYFTVEFTTLLDLQNNGLYDEANLYWVLAYFVDVYLLLIQNKWRYVMKGAELVDKSSITGEKWKHRRENV